jgi:hypothetical protein
MHGDGATACHPHHGNYEAGLRNSWWPLILYDAYYRIHFSALE